MRTTVQSQRAFEGKLLKLDDLDVECVYPTHEGIEARITAGEMRDEKTMAAWLLYSRSDHP